MSREKNFNQWFGLLLFFFLLIILWWHIYGIPHTRHTILWTQDFYDCLAADLVLSRTLPLFLLTFLTPSVTIPPSFYKYLAALTKKFNHVAL